MWLSTTRLRSTPKLLKISSCSRPRVPSVVWVQMGAPVSAWARDAARNTLASVSVMSFEVPISPMTVARTPVPSMPSVSSFTMMSHSCCSVSV